MRFWKSKAQRRRGDVLERLRLVAVEAAEYGYYGEYLEALVRVAVRNVVPANPDEEIVDVMEQLRAHREST